MLALIVGRVYVCVCGGGNLYSYVCFIKVTHFEGSRLSYESRYYQNVRILNVTVYSLSKNVSLQQSAAYFGERVFIISLAACTELMRVVNARSVCMRRDMAASHVSNVLKEHSSRVQIYVYAHYKLPDLTTNTSYICYTSYYGFCQIQSFNLYFIPYCNELDFQEKNVNLDRDLNHGSPDLYPGALNH